MSEEATTNEAGTQEVQKNDISNLKQSYLTRLSGKISLKSVFAAVAGVAAVSAAAIAAPVFVPLAGAFAAAALITTAGIGITWAISQHKDYKKLANGTRYYSPDEMKWHNYYKNSKLTQNLGKLSLKGVFATTALGAAAAATAIVGWPLLPLVGAAAAASAIATGGTSIVYGFRRGGRPSNI